MTATLDPGERPVSDMMLAVQFDRYGDRGVLEVRPVARPAAGPGEVLVEVRASGINPGETMIRQGAFEHRWPATFPSGQGTDFAGVVRGVGKGVAGCAAGDEVAGFSNRRTSHAQYVAVPLDQVTPKPRLVPWEVAGSLFVAGSTAVAAIDAVGVKSGDVVAVAGATGGVGTITVQLLKQRGAIVLGISGTSSARWLKRQGVTPVPYGEARAARLLAASPVKGIDAFLDMFGGGYVTLALGALGVEPGRINTIIDFDAVANLGVQGRGHVDAANVEVLAGLLRSVDDGDLIVPVAATFALMEVREAFELLERRHSLGKVVLTY